MRGHLVLPNLLEDPCASAVQLTSLIANCARTLPTQSSLMEVIESTPAVPLASLATAPEEGSVLAAAATPLATGHSSAMDEEAVHTTPRRTLNLLIPSRVRPTTDPAALSTSSYASVTNSPSDPSSSVSPTVLKWSPPLPQLASMRTWQKDSEEVTVSASLTRDQYRGQPADFHTSLRMDTRDATSIEEASKGDQIIHTALYGIIHRLYMDCSKGNAMDDAQVARLKYILQQAGIPSEHESIQGIDNGIQLDEDWMQEYNNKLALRRDCTQAWPPSDGIIFKIQSPILCGATCILDDQGAPVIFGETQRILSSELSKSGRYKAVLLQWLPNPVDVMKILDQDRWANLGVVRGLSQGFEDSAVTTMGLYAIQDYLTQIGLDPTSFTLVYRSRWFTDHNALRPRPTEAAQAKLDIKPSSKRTQDAARIPELLLCIVFTNTAADCPDGSNDAEFVDLQQQFFNLGVRLGPVALVHWGFHFEILASVSACESRPWRRLDSMVDTNCTVITGIQGKCFAKDLLLLLYQACGPNTFTWQMLFDICCVIVIPSQRNRSGNPSHARALLVWHGDPTHIPKVILRPLQAEGPLGQFFDAGSDTLPGLRTYIQAGRVAGSPPHRIWMANPDIYPGAAQEDMPVTCSARDAIPFDMRGPDSDDIFTPSGPGLTDSHVPNVKVSYYGNSASRLEAIRASTNSTRRWRGDPAPFQGRGGFASNQGCPLASSGDARQHGREVTTSSQIRRQDDESAPPTKRSNHYGPAPVEDNSGSQPVPMSAEPPGAPGLIVRADANSMVTQQDSALLQSFAAMLSAQLGATMQAMSIQQAQTAVAAKSHMEYTVQRAALETSARALTVEGDQIAREMAVARSNASDAASAAWYSQQQGRLVVALELRETQLGVRKSALERQYQLLNDAHEDVGVRPSLW